MAKILLCSNCFKDQGLKIDSFHLGILKDTPCPNCKTEDGRKLSRNALEHLAHRFFVRGTFNRVEYGGAPIVQMNKYHYKKTEIIVSEWLKDDLELIENTIKVGFYYYGPRMWMIGEVEPLKSLQKTSQRSEIIESILKEYPTRIFSRDETFYRLRKDPKNPSKPEEYDSPPSEFVGQGRLDSKKLPILYGSQDLEVCVHECRVTVDDELFLATLNPTKDLKLLDLTELILDDTTEFESLDVAVHLLFSAKSHSYKISRKIALAVYKAGFDGIIYPSYFSMVRTGAIPFETLYGISIRKLEPYKEYAKSQIIENIALFGRPIKKGSVAVKCINRLILQRIGYNLVFGPVEH